MDDISARKKTNCLRSARRSAQSVGGNCSGSAKLQQVWPAALGSTPPVSTAPWERSPPGMAKRSRSPLAFECCGAIFCPVQAVLEVGKCNWCGDSGLDQHSYPFSLMLTCSVVPQTPCIKPDNYLAASEVVTFLCGCYMVQFSLHLPSHSFLQPSLNALSYK